MFIPSLPGGATCHMKFIGGNGTGDGGGGGGRTVLVGVKFDPCSRELLTWALVKVAQPGDLVIIASRARHHYWHSIASLSREDI